MSKVSCDARAVMADISPIYHVAHITAERRKEGGTHHVPSQRKTTQSEERSGEGMLWKKRERMRRLGGDCGNGLSDEHLNLTTGRTYATETTGQVAQNENVHFVAIAG